YAARFSVRALEVSVDSTVVWVGAGLAIAAAVLLAYVPRLPSAHAPAGLGLANGGVRITPGTNRRLRLFATAQIAFSFILLAGAGMLLATLVAMQTANTGLEMRHVLAFDVPPAATGVFGPKMLDFFDEATRRVSALPGVEAVSIGSTVPWRDGGQMPRMRFGVDGYAPANGEENPLTRFRIVAPRFFGVLGVPVIAGRDFNDGDRGDAEPVAIVSQSFVQRFAANGDAVNRTLRWTDPTAKLFGLGQARRIIGVVADIDDEHIVREPAVTVYVPVRQLGFAGRLFVRTSGDAYALVPAVTRTIRG